MVNQQEEIKELKNLLQITKEDLQDLERYVQELSMFLPLPICTVNPLGIIVNVNKAFSDLTGYKEMEVTGEKAEMLFSQRTAFREFEKQLLRQEKKVLFKELTLLTKERKEVPVRVAGGVRKDEEDNIIGYFLAISDISEIKSLQQELERKVKERTAELEKRTKELIDSRHALMNILEDIEQARDEAEKERDKTAAIIENFPEGILVFDPTNKLISINPKAKEFFGFEKEDLAGRSLKELQQIPQLSPLLEVLGKERILLVRKKELSLSENLILEVSTIPIFRKTTKIGTLVLLRDVTREKFIERLKTEFVSIAAHQLRTPLSAIKWTIRMLLDGDVGEITQEQRELLEKTYASNERMIHLINDLLNVTRIEEGRFLYNLRKEDIIKLIEKVIAPLKDVAKRKKIKMKFRKPSGKVPMIKIDAEKISLCVQNLVDNAIRYTYPGGEVDISVKYLKNKQEILFSVKDTGIGIPKEQQGRVFSRFFRAENAIREETEGTGLGLFITKNIIEAHGGKIWFESEEGKGTTFYFTLPLKKEEFEKFVEEI